MASSQTAGTSSNNAVRESLASLQAGRGAAALMVLLYHLSLTFNKAKYWGTDHPLRNALALVTPVCRPERLRRYSLKRVVRIYPIYWLILLALLPLYFLTSSFGKGMERDPATIISSFALIEFDALNPLTWTACGDEADHSVLAVAWTLYHEILFYAVFALAI